MTEIDTRGNGEIAEKRPYEHFTEYLARRAESEDANRAFDVSSSQMDKLLSVEKAEDVWDADEGGTVSGQDFIDIPFQIRAFGISKSSEQYDAELGVYALIDAVRLDNQESVIINTGSTAIITKLRQLERFKMLPAYAYIKGIPTSRGNTVLKLRPYKPGPPLPVQGTTVTSDE